ncbi:MAG: ArsR family transcriptional regulator [Alphaproteobacteria bacterium]|nr:MAG: ArsR family transcriptional regulator [Alphaproteobacteria bacterium]
MTALKTPVAAGIRKNRKAREVPPSGAPSLSNPVRSAEAGLETISRLAKALAHPARVEIVRLLHEKQTCIGCDIVDGIGLAQSTTSEHLRILKAAGVIVGEIERPRVCYSLNPAALAPLRCFLDMIGANPPVVARRGRRKKRGTGA